MYQLILILKRNVILLIILTISFVSFQENSIANNSNTKVKDTKTNTKELTSYLPKILTNYEKFVNRHQELGQIEQGFINKQVIVITGRGGVGKSSLAIEYGKRHKDSLIVRYFNADSSSKINQTYQELAQEIGIKVTDQSPFMIMQLVNNKLASLSQKILFIFDNVEHYGDIKDYIINLPLNVKTLITTRKPQLILDSLHIKLEEFSNEAAKEYLEYSLHNRLLSKEAIQAIVNNTNALPYDLKCISAYLLDNSLVEVSVISQETVDEIKGKLFEEFITSSDKIKQQAWQILQYAAYLDPDFISMELVKEIFSPKEERVSAAIKKLESLSLISVIADQNDKLGFAIHRKLQKLTLYSIKNYPEYALNQQIIVDNLLIVVDKQFPKIDRIFGIKWQLASQLYPHIIKLFNFEVKPMSEKAKFAQASLYYKLAQYYRNVNINFKYALEYAKRALNLRYVLYNETPHIEIATTLDLIGEIYRKSGNAQESLQYLIEGLKIKEQLYSGDSQDIVESLYSLGWTYKELGEVQKALKYSKLTLDMNRRLYQENHLNTSRSLTLIGVVYLDLGEFDKSLKFFKESLQMLEALHQDKNSRIAILLDYISQNYHKLGKYTEALNYAKSALDVGKELYPNGHPDIAYYLRSYGTALTGLDRIEDGLDALNEALDIAKRFNMYKHSTTASIYYNLGVGYFRHKEYGRALKYAKKALILRREIYAIAKNHLEITESLHSLGDIYLATGDKAKALESYNEALVMSLALSLDHLSETKEIQQKIKELKR